MKCSTLLLAFLGVCAVSAYAPSKLQRCECHLRALRHSTRDLGSFHDDSSSSQHSHKCCVCFNTDSPKKSVTDLQKAATGAFAAFTIASSVLTAPPADAVPPAFSSSNMVAEKVVREGVYGEFEYDMPEQKYDDARSTFKAAKETKSKKGKFVMLVETGVPGVVEQDVSAKPTDQCTY